MIRKTRATMLFLSLLALLAAACAPGDPLVQLQAARAQYEVELINWGETTLEPEPQVAPEEEAAAEEEAAPAEPVERVAVISLSVIRGQTTVNLPCLTVDLVFQGEGGAELERRTIELDLSGIETTGGRIDITRRESMPDAPVAGVGVVKHVPVDEQAWRNLCEAEGIPGLAE